MEISSRSVLSGIVFKLCVQKINEQQKQLYIGVKGNKDVVVKLCQVTVGTSTHLGPFDMMSVIF